MVPIDSNFSMKAEPLKFSRPHSRTMTTEPRKFGNPACSKMLPVAAAMTAISRMAMRTVRMSITGQSGPMTCLM